ncbi:hypothetical protein NA57DRAFT_52438 [Rhizodiscina lignyota]|uniref:Uncharacterized protein n=1 Tax=Rhizodiscina lignyota TaxID=1504668 RepID=A0A9P4IP87_9PEZI|nr:hypothetical protein NA57DRAFT_52438 [Rhizodiscina lignyota]
MGALKTFRNWIFRFWTTIQVLLMRCLKSMSPLLLQFTSATREGTRQLVHGTVEEEPRVVMKTVERTTPSHRIVHPVRVLARTMLVLQHCSIHIIPIFATITLAYLNLAGFFIGENLAGSTAGIAQNMDRLSLQVVAKLVELFIIASLGVIILDAIRDKMMYGGEGVPLGLVTAPFRIGDISFLFSHEFRAGSRGFQRRRTRWMFALLIVGCALVAIFVGPSTALLLIPSFFESWPGGGASIWLKGVFLPNTLDVSSSWDPRCMSVTHNATLLNDSDRSLASCPWAGFPYLAEALAQSVFSPGAVFYSDYISRRAITLWWGGSDIPIDTVRMSAVGINVAAGAVAQTIGGIWCDAVFNAPQAAPGHRLANLHERSRNGSRGNLDSPLPLVRTECFNASYFANLLEEHGLNMNSTLPFPVITDIPTPPLAAYLIPVNTSQARNIGTQWIPIPDGISNTTYGNTTNNYPSAFLVIRNSSLPMVDPTITCTVEAQWAPGLINHDYLCWGPQGLEGSLTDHYGSMIDWAVTRNVPASGVPDFQSIPSWEHVSLTMDWLNLLTPALDLNRTGHTTLASVLESLPQRGYLFQGVQSPFIAINAIVASFVADGMSRVGFYENNIADLNSTTMCTKVDAPPNPGNNLGDRQSCLWQASSNSWLNLWKDILNYKVQLTPYPPPTPNTGHHFRYYVTVTGWGIQATSVAYYLALTVLFVYVAIALGHIGWTFYRGRISNTWKSLTDFLVLSQASPAPVETLKDTSTGVGSHKTLKTQVRIRNNARVAQGQETLQLLFGEDGENALLEQVLDNKQYGAKL